MTSVTNIPGASAQPAPAGSNPAAALDQTAFLRLMTTQLTTQDPFNPIDNTQMVAQMAQFSQVAGIAEMNSSLQTIAASLTGNRVGDSASWIGRSALVASDVATPLRDGSYAGEVELPANADAVSVSLVDENGAVVHTMPLGAREAGLASFSWDGRNAEGEAIAGGPLRVVVNATAAGQPLEAPVATWTSIGGIQSPANGGATRLVTGLGLLPVEAAIRLA